MTEPILDKLTAKLEGILDQMEDKPIESILKVVIMYVVFKQLFKKKQQ